MTSTDQTAEPPAKGEAPPTRDLTVERVLTLATWLSLLVIVGSAALVLTFDYGRDQAIYALVAREMLDGKMPYRDAFDFKPPGVFIVYALTRALFGGGQGAIRIVEVLSMLGTTWGLVRLSELHLKRRSVGVFAAAIASQIHAQLDFWHTAQPESFGGTLTIWGLVAATRALEAPTTSQGAYLKRHWKNLARWVLSGALFGASGLMKPPLAGVGAVLVMLVVGRAIWIARSARSPFPKHDVLAPLLGVGIGGALPFVLVLGWFAAKGAIGDLHQVLFVFTPYYTKLSWENASVLGMSYYGLTEWLSGYSSALLFGLVCLALFRPKREELPVVAAVFGAIFVHVAGIVMQGKFFPYHWGATFPLTAFLAALGIERALVASARRGPVAAAAFAVAFGLGAAARCPVPSFGEAFVIRSKARIELLRHPPADRDKAWDAFATVADVDAGENRAVAQYVAAHTKPTDPIFVWGFECIIYDLAQRPLASRYIYNVPQRATWSAKPMQAALMADLTARPPAAIVVEHRDVFPAVTGNNDDSARALFSFPELAKFLEDNYRYDTTIGDFDVYVVGDDEADFIMP